jgi:hypothetical protein
MNELDSIVARTRGGTPLGRVDRADSSCSPTIANSTQASDIAVRAMWEIFSYLWHRMHVGGRSLLVEEAGQSCLRSAPAERRALVLHRWMLPCASAPEILEDPTTRNR